MLGASLPAQHRSGWLALIQVFFCILELFACGWDLLFLDFDFSPFYCLYWVPSFPPFCAVMGIWSSLVLWRLVWLVDIPPAVGETRYISKLQWHDDWGHRLKGQLTSNKQLLTGIVKCQLTYLFSCWSFFNQTGSLKPALKLISQIR